MENLASNLSALAARVNANRDSTYAELYDWDGKGELPARIASMVANQYPLPATIGEAWEEFVWLCGCSQDEHTLQLVFAARRHLVETQIAHIASGSVKDITLKLRFLRATLPLGRQCEVAEALIEDVGRILTSSTTTAGRRRTNKDKQRETLLYLANPDTAHFSDREISRRAGVSPQTVSNWRRKLADEKGQSVPVQRTVFRKGSRIVMETSRIGHHIEGDESIVMGGNQSMPSSDLRIDE